MPKTPVFNLRMPPDLMDRIDSWRKDQRCEKDRSGAVRILLDTRLHELGYPAQHDSLHVKAMTQPKTEPDDG